MNNLKFYSALQALLAALLFGASAPLAKLFLGEIDPIPLASCLYLGSGIGLLLYRLVNRLKKGYTEAEAKIHINDVKWILGAVAAGGVAAPIVLMYSLRNTPASTASLLLNFECVATTLIAAVAFKEAIGKRIWFAIVFITSASSILTWDFSGEWGLSIGALGVLLACILWGMDNNFTRMISAKDPLIIVTIKGIGAGCVSLILANLAGSHFPDLKIIMGAMLLGFFSYGLSIVLFIFAMRHLGASRTSAFLGTAPFAGALLSFLLFQELPNTLFYAASLLMIVGAALIFGEEHEHKHIHHSFKHEHKHRHDDDHHNHDHLHRAGLEHSHEHTHETIEHSHGHTPDIHHRHVH
ncbi:DMT family transporter [Desulfosporosinus orientis]|uniref:DMT family transporter n=1 Tax=Desulfosporosinus orientis TaxID=1563 RepID=UPI00030D5FA9|nr:DMT family transporter [Desulfosporosinus orientis]